MPFYVDTTRNIAFGWAGKAGCRYIRMIIAYLTNAVDDMPRHGIIDESWADRLKGCEGADARKKICSMVCSIPRSIDHIYVYMRNPYARLVSGYVRILNRPDIGLIFKCPYETTLLELVSGIISNKWVSNCHFDHHFHPQAKQHWNMLSAQQKSTATVVPIDNIDFDELEELYRVKVPDNLRSWAVIGIERPIEEVPRTKEVQFTSEIIRLTEQAFACDFAIMREHGIICNLPEKYK
jgi:hypothetical protein